jgi:phosphate uptake regulator
VSELGLSLIASGCSRGRFLRATLDAVLALKGLKRIGDHAKNVAEQVLHMVGDEAEPDRG